MRTTSKTLFVGLVLILLGVGCSSERDGVLQGAYGPAPMSPSSSGVMPPASTGSSTGAATGTAGSNAMAGANPMPSSSGSVPGQPSAQPPAPGNGGAAPTPGIPNNSGAPTPSTAGAEPCNMSGRWLSTVHNVTDALGQLQYAHAYIYYEITQTGQSFMVTKGLLCGDDALGGGALAATVDLSASRDAAASRVNYVGRTGTSAAVSGGCQVDLQKWYTVRGATLPYYLDPAIPMPSAEQPAMGSTPGWEDWDMDGNPGITGVIAGVISGRIFTAPRQWTAMSGAVPAVSSSFTLPLMWDQEQNVMAVDGSDLLATQAVRAADATLHFVQFARLTNDQAVGDDKAICASILQLAPTLTPQAAGM